MSFWSRMANVFRGDRLSREIDEELQRHIADAIEQGRDPAEARRAFGSVLRNREESRDVRLISWLDSLRSDAVFSWRQLVNRKVTSGAAILSLALGIGACTSAFRLGKHGQFANDTLESTLKRLEITSGRSILTATVNAPSLLYHPYSSIVPRKRRVAPAGTKNRRGAPDFARPEPIYRRPVSVG
jgi:hypothetical protein